MKNKFGSRMGFTLIELLVVVLIIGILTAVAVPQYQKAIAKARFTQMVTASNAIREAEMAYYLNNGVFTRERSKLLISLPIKSAGAFGKEGWQCHLAYTYDGVANENITTLSASRISCVLDKPNIAYQQYYLSKRINCCSYASDGYKGDYFCKQLTKKQNPYSNSSSMHCYQRS